MEETLYRVVYEVKVMSCKVEGYNEFLGEIQVLPDSI